MEIRAVIVIPTHKETKSIERLLKNLLPKSSSGTAVIICHNSGENLRGFYRDLCSGLERRENVLTSCHRLPESKNLLSGAVRK